MSDKEIRDNNSDSLSQIFQDIENTLIETVEKLYSQKIKNPTRAEEMKEYLERVLEFAKGENKEYAAFLDNKIKTTKVNFKTENDLEWGNAKFFILIKNNFFPIKSEYTYGKDKKTVEKLINDAKRVLEYAKNLNPEYYKLLINDLLFFDQDKLYNNWYYINRLATYSLEIKEKEGSDLTIDQLMKGPYANPYIYTVVDFLREYIINYNMHAREILKNMEPEFKYIFSKEYEENPNKKK